MEVCVCVWARACVRVCWGGLTFCKVNENIALFKVTYCVFYIQMLIYLCSVSTTIEDVLLQTLDRPSRCKMIELGLGQLGTNTQVSKCLKQHAYFVQFHVYQITIYS